MAMITKTSLFIFLLFFIIGYIVLSTFLINWYFQSRVQEISTTTDIKISYIIGLIPHIDIPSNLLSNNVDMNALKSLLKADALFNLLNILVFVPSVAIVIWVFVPTDT